MSAEILVWVFVVAIALSYLAFTGFFIYLAIRNTKIEFEIPFKFIFYSFFGIAFDIRIMGLLAALLSMIAYFYNENWQLLSLIIAYEFFILSALNTLLFLFVEASKFWKKEPLKNYDSEVIFLIRLSSGFWSFAGLIVGFSLLIFQIPMYINYQPFEGLNDDGILYYEDAFLFTIETLLSMLPHDMNDMYNWTVTEVEMKNGNYSINTLLLVFKLMIDAVIIKLLIILGLNVKTYFDKKKSESEDVENLEYNPDAINT